jgi:hypothetical protein
LDDPRCKIKLRRYRASAPPKAEKAASESTSTNSWMAYFMEKPLQMWSKYPLEITMFHGKTHYFNGDLMVINGDVPSGKLT